MKTKLQSLLLLLMLSAAWTTLQARTWKQGDLVAYSALKAGDVVLLNNGVKSDAIAQWLGGYITARDNYWTHVRPIGVFQTISDRSAFKLVAAPAQHEGVNSYYLQEMETGKYISGSSGNKDTQLTSDLTKATSFEIEDAKTYGSFANAKTGAGVLTHYDGSTKNHFGPFHAYTFTFYGDATDIICWNFYRAVEEEHSYVRGAQVGPDEIKDGMKIVINNGASYYSNAGFDQYLDNVVCPNTGLVYDISGGSSELAFNPGIANSKIWVVEGTGTKGVFRLKNEAKNQYLSAGSDGGITITADQTKALTVQFDLLSKNYSGEGSYSNGKWNVKPKSVNMYHMDGTTKCNIGQAWEYGYAFYKGGDNVPLNIFTVEDATSARGTLRAALNTVGDFSPIAGTTIGCYKTEAANAYTTAKTNAENLIQQATATDEAYSNAAQTLLEAYKTVLNAYIDLTDGSVFYITRTSRPEYSMTALPGDYSGLNLMWNKTVETDPRYMWKFIKADDDNWYIQNIGTAEYINTTEPSSYGFASLSQTPTAQQLKALGNGVFKIKSTTGSDYFCADYPEGDPTTSPGREALPNGTGRHIGYIGGKDYSQNWTLVPVEQEYVNYWNEAHAQVARNVTSYLSYFAPGTEPGCMPQATYDAFMTYLKDQNAIVASGNLDAFDNTTFTARVDEAKKAVIPVVDAVYNIKNNYWCANNVWGNRNRSWWYNAGATPSLYWKELAANDNSYLFSFSKASGDQSFTIKNIAAGQYVGPFNNDSYATLTKDPTPVVCQYTYGGSFLLSDGTHYYGMDGNNNTGTGPGNIGYKANDPMLRKVKLATVGYEVTITDDTHASDGTAEGNLATIVLPRATVIPDGIKAYILTEETANAFKATEVSGIIPANTPVLILGKAGSYVFHTSTGTGNAAAFSGNLLRGTGEEGTDVAAGKVYVLTTAGNQAIFSTTTAMKLPKRKAYLPISNTSSPKYIIFGNTTGITDAVTDQPATDVYYDLQGRRIMRPAKGIVIKNGHKVAIQR